MKFVLQFVVLFILSVFVLTKRKTVTCNHLKSKSECQKIQTCTWGEIGCVQIKEKKKPNAF